MCLDASHCPHRPVVKSSAKDYFDLMCHRLAGEGGLLSESALRESWRQRGMPTQALDELLAAGRLCRITWRA
ncbi:hypothetical protein WDZ92_31575, partial [Nostoc sp. NIES-2111]